MSETQRPPGYTDDPEPPEPGDDDFLDHHREEIEREAQSDAPDAWVFEQLVHSLEESEDGGSS